MIDEKNLIASETGRATGGAERVVMDQRALAEAILDYEDLSAKLKSLESDILAAVMYYGRTVEIAGIRARYSDGRRTYDWEGYLSEMIESFDPADYASKMEANTKRPPKPTPRVSWAAFGKELGVKPSMLVEAGFSSKGAPSAKIEVIR